VAIVPRSGVRVISVTSSACSSLMTSGLWVAMMIWVRFHLGGLVAEVLH
jgi:hypothetical protein